MKAIVIVGFADLNGIYRNKGDVVAYSEPYITRLVEGGLVKLEQIAKVEATSDEATKTKPLSVEQRFFVGFQRYRQTHPKLE